MKVIKLLSVLFLSSLLFACSIDDQGNITFGWDTMPPCILHTGQSFDDFCAEVNADDSRKSYICEIEAKYNVDPCVGYRVIEFAAKEGALFDVYTQDEWTEWSDKGKTMIKSGITFNDMKLYAIAQVKLLNKRVGQQIALFGDMFIYLPDKALIPADDQTVLTAVFIDLDKEVEKMQYFK